MESRRTGRLHVIYGPMFSGKSTELLRLKRRSELAKRKTVLFKPIIDDRYAEDKVVTHDGNTDDALLIQDIEEVLDYVYNLDDISELPDIFIDEVQFLHGDLSGSALKLILDGINVTAAGLNTDFRGVPFYGVPELITIAHTVTRLTAICEKCGEDAIMTQRLIDGRPAKLNDPIIYVGGKENYEARCLECFELGAD